MKNKSSIGLIILLIVLVFVLGIFIFKSRKEATRTVEVNQQLININTISDNHTGEQQWLSSNFKRNCDGTFCPYAVDISYPKNYTFNCCGDMDTGTIHSIFLKQDSLKTENLIEVLETTHDPRPSYEKDLESRKLKIIDNVTTDNIGVSIMAVSIENTDYKYAGNTSYEEYFFKIKKQDGKMEYLSVKFYRPADFTNEFKSEFLNRLKIWK